MVEKIDKQANERKWHINVYSVENIFCVEKISKNVPETKSANSANGFCRKSEEIV